MDETHQKLQIPAILMIIIGIAAAMWSFAGVLASIPALLENGLPGDGAPFDVGYSVGLIIGSLLPLLGIPVGGLISFGGWSMYKKQRYQLVFLSALLLLVPCYWSCCGLGVPLSIWVLVLLQNQDVKDAFIDR